LSNLKHVRENKTDRVRSAAMATAIILFSAASMWAAGTTMTLTFGTPTVACTTNGGSVSAPYTIATTAGDGASVTETLTLNGTEVKSHTFTIPGGNIANGGGWTFAGRTKTFDGTFTADGLANGTYTLEVCAAQNGSNGNPAKSVCQSETVVVSCATPDPVCSSGPFGEVVGNKNISVNATAQINFKGAFGDAPLLTITSQKGVAASAPINRDGNSCNYHANWSFTGKGKGADIDGNDGPGTYTVVVTGNGQSVTFFVTLVD
jgi:hypothetical protein